MPRHKGIGMPKPKIEKPLPANDDSQPSIMDAVIDADAGPGQGLRRPPLTRGGGPVAQVARSANHNLLLLLGARTPLLMPMARAVHAASETCARTCLALNLACKLLYRAIRVPS